MHTGRGGRVQREATPELEGLPRTAACIRAAATPRPAIAFHCYLKCKEVSFLLRDVPHSTLSQWANFASVLTTSQNFTGFRFSLLNKATFRLETMRKVHQVHHRLLVEGGSRPESSPHNTGRLRTTDRVKGLGFEFEVCMGFRVLGFRIWGLESRV